MFRRKALQWLRLQRTKLPPPTAVNLWLALAAVVAWHNLWILHATQEQPKLVLYVLLLWWGALTCMEDRLETLRLRPSGLSALLGSLLLLWCLWRSSQLISIDAVVALITPLEGLALVWLCVPLSRMRQFWQQLLILALLPPFCLITQNTPVSRWIDGWISPLTAASSAGLLSTLGFEAFATGRIVQTTTGAVSVAGACNGLDQIGQLLAIALIFSLAFPLRSRLRRLLCWVAALIIPLITNAVRIALLAQIVSLGGRPGTPGAGWWFDFFHEEMGSLIFSGLAVFLFGAIYLWLIEAELESLQPYPPELDHGDSPEAP
jgi:cyanoexosortase A